MKNLLAQFSRVNIERILRKKMTTVYAELRGDKALLSRSDLEHLVELARRSETVALQTSEDELPTLGIMKLAEQGGAFDWLADEEDLYTVEDLKVRYR